jgi:hypothetical protein
VLASEDVITDEGQKFQSEIEESKDEVEQPPFNHNEPILELREEEPCEDEVYFVTKDIF